MGIIGIFTLETVKTYSNDHPEMWIIAMVLMFVSLITLACCEGVRRKTPHNFIFLGLFTCAEGFMLGTVTSTYNANEVLLAVGVTAAIVLALTIFAFQTKIDFTAMGGKWNSVILNNKLQYLKQGSFWISLFHILKYDFYQFLKTVVIYILPFVNFPPILIIFILNFRYSACCLVVFRSFWSDCCILPSKQNCEPRLCRHRMHHLQHLHHLWHTADGWW